MRNSCLYFGKCINDTLQYEMKQYPLLIFKFKFYKYKKTITS